jgi:ribonuclease R
MGDHFEHTILGAVARPDYKPATARVLARRLGIAPERYAEFRDAVKRLVKSGRLDRGKDRALKPAGAAVAAKGTVIGTFRRAARGFGFVRPKAAVGRESDIFIPEDEAGDAATGDEVAVKIAGRTHRPGAGASLKGRIVRVVSRASGQFVGTYFEDGGDGYVKVDGTTFHEPIFVGDPGAKGARPGDKVAFEMVRYPGPLRGGEGVLTEVLGPRGQPGVDTLTVIRAFGIPDAFDDETLDEAREQARRFDEEHLGQRLDLRDALTVTIDPATARDFDDAITLERDDAGFWTLGVHIADVTHFVRVGSRLDRTARTRGTSVYLPDRVIPMLPEVLSNSLASLQEGRARYTVSALMQFDAEGRRTHTRFARSAIRVDKRFTYEQAFAVMKDRAEAAPDVTPELRDQLKRMLELALILRRRRFRRGALELVMPEVEVDLDEHGIVVGAHLAPDDESHQVIEEFMLAANEAVAEHLTERGVWFLRRAHPDPEPHKLEQFAEFVAGLGFTMETPRSRFELQKVLAWSDDRPERHAVHYGLLRSLKQAAYTVEPQGHYALASDNYCHFTSPIRRYPDIQVHRQLVALLEGHKPKADPDELAVLAEHCTRTERRAEIAERELIKIKLLTHLEGRIGEQFHALITGVEDFGLFCQLVELPIDGLLHVTSLADDFYYREPEAHTLVGRRSGRRFRLGDRIPVRVARVDVDRRELDLVPADHPEGTDEAEAHLPPARNRRRIAPNARAPRVVPPPDLRPGGRGPARPKRRSKAPGAPKKKRRG